MKRVLVLAAVLLFLSSAALSQSFSTGLAQTLEREVPGELERNHEPGLSVALVEGCKVQWSKGFGMADRKQGTRVSADTIFELGSISKTFTAWVVMKLVEEGKLSLDADANTYLKRWKVQDSDFGKAKDVTVRRLLNHTAGI